MKNRLQQVVEQRLTAVSTRQKELVESWRPYLNAVDTYLSEKENRTMSDYEKQQVAQCLENALIEGGLRHKSRIFETTYKDNITFLGIQLPVIAALLPSLVLNQIAIVQALDRRQGAVFYLDVQAGTTKGSIQAGSKLIDAKTGHATSTAAKRYATELVYGEAIGASGSTGYTKIVAFFPLRAGTAIVTDGVETFTDNGNNVMVSDVSGGTNGSINYTTGEVIVTFAVTTTVAPTIDYQYNYEKVQANPCCKTGVPELNINLTQSSIEAIDFPLRSKYTLGAAIDLEKAHGLVLEDELVKYLGGEIKFEIDHYGIEQITTAAESVDAAATFGTWTATPTNGQEWLWKKYELIDRIESGSNNIFAKTLRGMATFILVGNNGARVIRQLEPHFKPDASLGKVTPTGPIVLGTLDGRTVIQDPFLPTNRIYLGYKGDSYLMAGFIYAPYIPLFSTPTLITSDLEAQKGFLSASGFKTVNAGLFNYGDISGLL
jgi:hypothetical protein